MLHPLLDWEYPHWMMVTGAILVAAGFIGLAFRKSNVEPAENNLTQEAAANDEPNPPWLDRASIGRRRKGNERTE